MSGIIAVYGLVVSVLIASGRESVFLSFYELDQADGRFHLVDPSKDYSLYFGFIHLAAGLSCGLTGLAAGYAIGIVGDSVSCLFNSLLNQDLMSYSACEHTSMNQEYS